METTAEIHIELIDKQKLPLTIVVDYNKNQYMSYTSTKPKLTLLSRTINKKNIDLQCRIILGVPGFHNVYDLGCITIDIYDKKKEPLYKAFQIDYQTKGYYHLSFNVIPQFFIQNKKSKEFTEIYYKEEEPEKFKILDINQIRDRLKENSLYPKSLGKDVKQNGALVLFHMLKKMNKQFKHDLVNSNKLVIHNIGIGDYDRKIIYETLTLDCHEISTIRSIMKPIINERFTLYSASVSLPTGEVLVSGGCSSDCVINNRGIYVINHKQKIGYIVAVLPIYLKKHTMKLIDGILYVLSGFKDGETIPNRRVYGYNLKTQIWSDMKDLSSSLLLSATGNANYLIAVSNTFGPFYCFDLNKKLNWEKKELSETIPQYTFIQMIKETDDDAFYIAKGPGTQNIYVLRLDFNLLEMQLIRNIESDEYNIEMNFIAHGNIYFTNAEFKKLHFVEINSLIDKKLANLDIKTFSMNLMNDNLRKIPFFDHTSPAICVKNTYDFSMYPNNGFYMQSGDHLCWYGDRKIFKSVTYEYNIHTQNTNTYDIVSMNNLSICSIEDGTLMILYSEYDDLHNKCCLVTTLGKISVEAPYSKRKAPTLVSNKEFVYMIGGFDNDNQSYNYIEVFDCLKGSWTQKIYLKTRVGISKCVIADNKMFILHLVDQINKVIILDLNNFEEEYISIDELEKLDINAVNIFAIKQIVMITHSVIADTSVSTDVILLENMYNIKVAAKMTYNRELKDIKVSKTEIRLLAYDHELNKIIMNSAPLTGQVEDIAVLLKEPKMIQETDMPNDFPINRRFKLFLSNAESIKFDKFYYYRYNKFRGIDDTHKKIIIFAENEVFLYNTNLNNVERLKSSRFIYKNSSISFLRDGRIIACGGLNIDNNITDEIWIYNYFLQKWKKSSAKLLKPRHSHKTLIVGSKLLVLGGYDAFNNPISYNEYVCLKHMRSYEFKPFNTPRAEFGLVAMGERILAIQGSDGSKVLSCLEYYSDFDNKWVKINNPNIGFKLKGFTAVKYNFRTVMIIGGINEKGKSNFKWRAVTLFNIYNNQKAIKSNHKVLSTNCENGNVIKANGELFIIGGNKENQCQRYKLLEEGLEAQQTSDHSLVSKQVVKLNFLRNYSDIHACYVDIKTNIDSADIQHNPDFDKLYLFRTIPLNKVIRLNLKTYQWQELEFPANFELQEHAIAKTLPNGDIFYGGGMKSLESTYSNTCYILKPCGDTLICKPIPPMFQKRYTFAVTYLDGYIYIIGGRFSGSVS